MSRRSQLRSIALPFLLGGALTAAAEENAPVDFDRLIELVESFDMPSPPQNAKLVLAHAGSLSVMGNSSTSHDPTNYYIGFLIRNVSTREAEVMSGWTRKIVSERPSYSPATRPFSLEFPEPKPKGYLLKAGGSDMLLNAVHLAKRGDRKTALKLMRLFDPEKFITSQFYDVEALAKKYDFSELVLIRTIWGYYESRLYDPEQELMPTYRQLVTLKDAYPEMFAIPYNSFPDLFETPTSTRELDLLADVEASLTAPKPKRGSVEALLIEWGNSPGNLHSLRFYDNDSPDVHQPAEKILEMGTSAIPALNALVDDRRFVRKINHSGWIKDRTPRPRLGELASFLIKEISGGEIPAVVAGPLTPEEERDYLKKKALVSGPLKIREFHNTSLRILAKKYPAALREIAEDVPRKTRKDINLWPLLESIESAALPKKERSEMLTGMAERTKGIRSRSILQVLAKLDADACKPHLKKALEKIPRDVNSPYWTCEEAGFTHVVMQISDADIWKQYLGIAKRASVGLRMEMMNPMNYSYVEGANEKLRIAFLAGFLDDEEIRDQSVKPKRYDGPCAAFIFDKIEVRDFVAMKICSILDLEFQEEPDEFWDEKKWSEFREAVGKTVEKIDLPNLAE